MTDLEAFGNENAEVGGSRGPKPWRGGPFAGREALSELFRCCSGPLRWVHLEISGDEEVVRAGGAKKEARCLQ